MTKAKGNMYNWVSHMSDPLRYCSHNCVYCYAKRWQQPKPILNEKELMTIKGEGKKIFVGHLGDMFCQDVPGEMIFEILRHCNQDPTNQYILQTKNPQRYFEFIPNLLFHEEYSFLMGTTIETNRAELIDRISRAPLPLLRAHAMRQITLPKFLTIEPIMDFDIKAMTEIVQLVNPSFVNIGADSKNKLKPAGVPEPPKEKILALITNLKSAGIDVRIKSNLKRLIGG